MDIQVSIWWLVGAYAYSTLLFLIATHHDLHSTLKDKLKAALLVCIWPLSLPYLMLTEKAD